jgi:succinate dehydrogenase/fumarate reductase flavoprotein subunit
MEKLSCGILVIGNGAAGLRAAIAAREAGAEEVWVVSKSPPGLGTCTILSGGALGAALGGLTREEHLAMTIESGRGINQRNLVETFVSEAPERIQELATWGMKMSVSRGFAMAHGAPPAFGREIIRVLMDRARKTGVRFLSHLVVWKLTADSGHGMGTLAYHSHKGIWTGILSKAVILAGGGCGALYPRHDNPQRMTGDGYALALGVGAKLQDMEFVQFYALAAAEPGRPPVLILPGIADRGFLMNDRGENILEKYHISERPAAARARDRLAQALFRETGVAGRHVYLDLTKASGKDRPLEYLTAANWNYVERSFQTNERPIRVSPVAHFMMGGISITPDAWTGIPGLFAAGEVTGGLHGANRLGGNALSECIVFGARAGVGAASWADQNRWPLDESRLARLERFIPRFTPGSSFPSPLRDFKERLRQIMWQHGGIFRERAGLTEGIRRLRQLEEEIDGYRPRSAPLELTRVLELRQGLVTARVILEAALRREESRGAHSRTDFPEQDEKWKGRQVVSLSPENGLQWSFMA